MNRVPMVEVPEQAGHTAHRPPPDSAVVMAIDLSRSKLVYCLRWDGAEQRRLSTPAGLEHVRAVVEEYQGCRLHVVYAACGFGYELAWWLQAQQVLTTDRPESGGARPARLSRRRGGSGCGAAPRRRGRPTTARRDRGRACLRARARPGRRGARRGGAGPGRA